MDSADKERNSIERDIKLLPKIVGLMDDVKLDEMGSGHNAYAKATLILKRRASSWSAVHSHLSGKLPPNHYQALGLMPDMDHIRTDTTESKGHTAYLEITQSLRAQSLSWTILSQIVDLQMLLAPRAREDSTVKMKASDSKDASGSQSSSKPAASAVPPAEAVKPGADQGGTAADQAHEKYAAKSYAPAAKFLKPRKSQLTIELVRVAEKGDLERLRKVIAAGANVHALDDLALRQAAMYGHLHIVRHLVTNCAARIDALDYDALCMAASCKRYQVVEFFARTIFQPSLWKGKSPKKIEALVENLTGKVTLNCSKRQVPAAGAEASRIIRAEAANITRILGLP